MHNYHLPTGRHQRRNNVGIEIRDTGRLLRGERADLAACRTPTTAAITLCSALLPLPLTTTRSSGAASRARTHHRNPNWDWYSSDTCGRAERSSSASYIGRVKLLSPARAASRTAILFSLQSYFEMLLVLWTEISIVKKQSSWSRLAPPPLHISLAVLFWSVLLNANAADYVLWS